MQLQDRSYLCHGQYRDGSNLAARQRLHREYAQTGVPWWRFVFRQLRLPERSRILEVGCGPGWLWRENRELIPSGWRMTLTDLSPGMLEEAARELLALGPQVTFQAADAVALPFNPGSFDAVVANHMLYHVPDRCAALAEFRRVLTPGGLLLAATNGPGHLSQLRELEHLVCSTATTAISSEFDLVNGPVQLRPWFAHVSVVRQPGWLAVTEAGPVLDYLRSMPGRRLAGPEADLVSRYVNAAINRDGSWRVESEAGVVRGRRRERVGRLPGFA
ncbi:MAG TPA: class I SAM-dependent methyltransferase [Candidatus Nanopelagicaceae bacterium]|nr:class I SAM-dependent methyltransferase [Candidatus Nanopelagicaceae bacterium]